MKLPVYFATVLLCMAGSQSACAQSEVSGQSGSEKTEPGPQTDSGAVPPGLENPSDNDFLAPQREPSEKALAGLAVIDGALKKIDENIERDGNGWQFNMGENVVIVITDPIAERMRIMVPIAPADVLTQDVLVRVMQANFDSALDARYAFAQNLLWGTYIHPLAGLEEDEFLSGLLQTINIVQNFGTSFSSGVVVFGGGDSQAIIENQLEELQKERERASKT